jgi:hypothetical protein
MAGLSDPELANPKFEKSITGTSPGYAQILVRLVSDVPLFESVIWPVVL